MSYSISGIHLLHYHVVFRSLSQADGVVSSLQHCCNFPPTQDPLSRTRHAHHLQCVKFNDSLIYFILCTHTQGLIYFLSRLGFTFASALSIPTGPRQSLSSRSHGHPQLSVICVTGHIKTMQAYIGQYVTCQNQACLFEVIKVIDLIIDDVSRFSMFHVFTIFKAESISYRLYVSISRFTG